ncbi:hypothetical protein K7432_004401 [Basidiobolus ranarum]|uniref:Uncharacterized protein n=1 Tax=Basidiobolus ranarum TaxID=34480 RepID=A0ABR2WYB9_9FUNG
MEARYKSSKISFKTTLPPINRILSGAEMVNSLREMDSQYKVNYTNWVTDERNVIDIGARFSQLVSDEYTIQQIGNAMLLLSRNWSDAARQYLFYTATSDWEESRREHLYWYLVTPRNPKHIITERDFTPQVCDVQIARTILRTHPYYIPRTADVKPISPTSNRNRSGAIRISVSSLLASNTDTVNRPRRRER